MKRFIAFLMCTVMATICFAQSAELKEEIKHYVLYCSVPIPGTDYAMLTTEVTQELYSKVMGYNISKYQNDELPVTNVSFYDAIVFCNTLSTIFDLTPVYSVKKTTNVASWKYTPGKMAAISDPIKVDEKANGFRLPTAAEWEYCAAAGDSFKYSGSDNADEVAWHTNNSKSGSAMIVAQKKPNAWGLYDMSGNVSEWVYDTDTSRGGEFRILKGGSKNDYPKSCTITSSSSQKASSHYADMGFRFIFVPEPEVTEQNPTSLDRNAGSSMPRLKM